MEKRLEWLEYSVRGRMLGEEDEVGEGQITPGPVGPRKTDFILSLMENN